MTKYYELDFTYIPEDAPPRIVYVFEKLADIQRRWQYIKKHKRNIIKNLSKYK